MANLRTLCFETFCADVPDTYTKTEVNQLIDAIDTLHLEVVQTLPATGDPKTIYLLPKTGETGDVYDEYVYVSGNWEKIGSTQVDLSDYYTKTEIDTTFDDYVLKAGDTMTGNLTIANANPTLTSRIFLGSRTNTARGLIDMFDSQNGGYYGRLQTPASLTANRTYTFPDKTGTVALVSDITTAATDGTVTKVGTATVGGSFNPIYLNAGTPAASTGTRGNATTPLYMNSGTLTAGSEYVPKTGGTFTGNVSIVNSDTTANSRLTLGGANQTARGQIYMYSSTGNRGILQPPTSMSNRTWTIQDYTGDVGVIATQASGYRYMFWPTRHMNAQGVVGEEIPSIFTWGNTSTASHIVHNGIGFEAQSNDETSAYGGRVGIVADTTNNRWHWSPVLHASANASYTDLGHASRRWRNCYLINNPTVVSDRRGKKDIKNLDKKYLQFFDKLSPKSYMRDHEEAERTHLGLIAQEVELALADVGMTSIDFAGLCKDLDEDGKGERYSLRYEQFIPILIAVVQEQGKRIAELESKK